MQESIFDLFGSRHSVVKQQHNPKQTTSVSSFHSLSVTSNLKQKSSSVAGSTALKRALGDVGNRLQPPRLGLGKEESRKPLSFSCEQKSPSLLLSNQPSVQDKAKCLPSFDWTAKPEIFPDPDITEAEDDYEDFFPIKERLTKEDVYRVVTYFGKTEMPKEILTPPDVILPLPFPDAAEENVQYLDIDISSDVWDEQVSLPDLLWEIADLKEEPLRHTL